MRNIYFIPNRWIKFLFKNKEYMGLTYLYDENNKEYEQLYQLVFLIKKERKTMTINFSECNRIEYLGYIAKENNFKYSGIKKEIILLNTKSNLTELAKKQINNISRN